MDKKLYRATIRLIKAQLEREVSTLGDGVVSNKVRTWLPLSPYKDKLGEICMKQFDGLETLVATLDGLLIDTEDEGE